MPLNAIVAAGPGIHTSTVVFERAPSLWRDHRAEVTAALVTATLLGLLAVALIIERRRRARTEAGARQQLIALAQLERSAAMGELSASIAHELNQPLGAILNNVEAARLMLSASPVDAAAFDETLASIRSDTDRAADVVRRFRALFRTQDLALRRVDANRAVRDTLDLVAAEALRRRVNVVPDLTPSAPPVAADPVQLQQALMNLLLNAIDAVAGCAWGPQVVKIQTVAEGDHARFCICNSGPAIAADDLSRVFDPLFTTKRPGTRMGLSIARTIVEKHGGRIWAENGAEGGAMVHFTLPYWTGKKDAAGVASPPGR